MLAMLLICRDRRTATSCCSYTQPSHYVARMQSGNGLAGTAKPRIPSGLHKRNSNMFTQLGPQEERASNSLNCHSH